MSMLRQKRKEFASVLEKACKQSATSNSSDSSNVFSDFADECSDSPTSSQWHGSATSTPHLDSILSISWPASVFGSDISTTSQLSPCIDGDSWPSDGCFSCPWNPSTDLEFLEADTADELLSRVVSSGPEITQTSMDLLDFLDGQTQTISHFGACLDIEDRLFRGADDDSDFSVLSFDLQPDCLKSDAWLHEPVTSDSDLDELLMRSASAKSTRSHHQAQSLPHPPAYCINDVVTKSLSKSLSTGRVADRVTKKHTNPNQNVSQAELLFRKERNRLRSKAYRLRRKMQFESMKKEVNQARQKVQDVQQQIQDP